MTLVIAVLCIIGLSGQPALTEDQAEQTTAGGGSGDRESSPELIAEGQRIFRYDTFGDEQLWMDKLRLHEVVEKSIDPTTALSVGLKVDADVLPPGILQKVDLKSAATTVMAGTGHRKDGWPNRDLNVGAIIALSPALTADQKAVYSSWGAGKYDPRYNQDGKNTPLVIPPAYGLAQIDKE